MDEVKFVMGFRLSNHSESELHVLLVVFDDVSVGFDSVSISVRLAYFGSSGTLLSFLMHLQSVVSSSSGSLLSFSFFLFILSGGFAGFDGAFIGSHFLIEDVLFQISVDVSGFEGFLCFVHLLLGGLPFILSVIPGF